MSDVKYCGESEISSTNVFNSCDKLGVVQVPTDYSYDSFCGVSVSKILDEKCEVDPSLPLISGKCGETKYRLSSDGTLNISGNGKMCSYTSYDSYPWYSYRSQIKKVVISEGVTSIGDEAFKYCTSLSSIEIPSSVTSIGSTAFE